MFCAAYRLGLAQSPQQSVMCGLLGSGQLLSQYQQNQQQGVNQNPCPSGTPSTVSTGFQSSATCSTATGVITTYNWLQTSGVPVTLSGLNTPTISFATPTNATTLVFSLQITDSNQVTSNQATATVQVP